MNELPESAASALFRGNVTEIAHLTRQALDPSIGPQETLERGPMKGMDSVGTEFRAGRMFIPEVLFPARTMQKSMGTLKPLLAIA